MNHRKQSQDENSNRLHHGDYYNLRKRRDMETQMPESDKLGKNTGYKSLKKERQKTEKTKEN